MSAPLPSPSTLPPWLERRPTKRSECPPPDQQCPWVSCRYHLAFDFKKMRLRESKQPPPKFLFSALPEDPELWPDDAATCALHVAEGGAHILEEVGGLLRLTRERVRQIENQAKVKLKRLGITGDLAEAFDLDIDAPPTPHNRPSAEAKGHRGPRPHTSDPDLDGTYSGPFRSQDMTAKMRKIQAESAAPCRTLSPDDIDLVALAEDLDRKRQGKPAPLGQRRSFVALDTFTQRAENTRATERYARSKESLRSFRRLQADTAPPPIKALTTTQPRPPSPPSTAPLEIPPVPTHAEATPPAPAAIQPDDQPEVAVVSALPDPQPTPAPPKPMPKPTRATHAKAQAWAIAAIKSTLAVRKMSPRDLIAAVCALCPARSPIYVQQGVSDVLSSTGSPISVWFRRVAAALEVSLSDLCDSPEWLSAVIPEDSPLIRAHRHRGAAPAPVEAETRAAIQAQVDAAVLTTRPVAQMVPLYELPPVSTPPQISPLAAAIASAQNQLSHVAGAAAHLEARVEDLTALAKILREEIDSLQQQLAERTRERDAATETLARIKAAL